MAETVDIVVAGAGTSGVIAALSAARAGKRVALVEATERLGGMAVHGLHRFVCGLFVSDGERPQPLSAGPTTVEFCSRLAGGPLETRAVRRGRVWVLPFDGGRAFESCAESCVAEEPTIRVFRRDTVTRVSVEQGRIVAMTLASGTTFCTDKAVDCTGDAAVCRLSGCGVEWPTRPALAGYGVEIEGVDEVASGALGLAIEVPLLMRKAVEAGTLPRWCAFTTCEPCGQRGRVWLKLAVPGEAQVSGAAGRVNPVEMAAKAVEVLNMHAAFRQARIRSCVPRLLPRETCHLKGEARLTAKDVLEARKAEDGLVRNAWPIEYWDEDRGVGYRYVPAGQWHDIPAGCLRPRGGPRNLLCAGMAISADSEAAASVRVMGVCMALGEAAAQLD